MSKPQFFYIIYINIGRADVRSRLQKLLKISVWNNLQLVGVRVATSAGGGGARAGGWETGTKMFSQSYSNL